MKTFSLTTDDLQRILIALVEAPYGRTQDHERLIHTFQELNQMTREEKDYTLTFTVEN